MATKPYSVSFEANFTTMIRDAQKASSSLSNIFKDATEKGFKNTDLKGIFAKVEKHAKDEYKLRQQLELRLERQRAEAEGRLDRAREQAFARILKKQKEMDEATDDEIKERLEAEYEIEKIRASIYAEGEEFNEETKKVSEALCEVVRELKGAEKAAKKSSYYFDRSAEGIGKISKFFRGDLEKGAESFVDTITSGLDGLMSKLTSSIDMGSLTKGLSGGASKGLASMADSLAKVAPALAVAAAGAAALVGVVGILVAAFFDADKRVKEFNKSAINTFGSLELASTGSRDLSVNLMALNRATHDLVANLGVTHEEAMGLLDTLSKGGMSLKRFSGGTADAAKQQQGFRDIIVKVGTTARAMGVSISDYSSTLTDYVNDLGQSLDTVNTSFAQIAKMASDSSFGTRRFYSMVVQASSGQASLNTKLEDTADLLMKMTKILGQKKALEMMGAHTNNLAGMSTQDRTKMLIQAGGRQHGVIAAGARSQARSFSQNAISHQKETGHGIAEALTQARLPTEIADAITRAGSATGREDIESSNNALIAAIQGMSRTQQNDTINALINNPATEAQGRGMQDLVRLVRGMNGSLGDQSEALTALGPRGSLMMAISSVRGVIGHAFDSSSQNDVAQLMATENIANMTSQQRQAMTALLDNSVSNFHELQRAQGANAGAGGLQAQADMVTRIGAAIDESGHMVRASIVNGQVVAGEEIRSSTDLLMANDTNNTGEAISEQQSLMQSTFAETVGIGDILENKIYQTLMTIASWGGPLMKALAKYMGVDTTATDTMQVFSQKMRANSDAMSGLQKNLATVRQKRQVATTGSERTALDSQIANLSGQLGNLQGQNQRLGDARERLSTGNTFDIRAGWRAQTDLGTTDENGMDVGAQSQVYATNAEAMQHRAAGGRVTEVLGTPMQALARALGLGGASTPATAVAPTAPTNANPTPSNSAPVTVAPSTVDTNAPQTEVVAGAINATGAMALQNANATTTENRRLADQRHRQGQQHLTRVLTRETKLGDALARSRLPDAIVEAQLKQEMMAMGTAAGLDPQHAAAAAAKFLEDGSLTDDLRTALQAHPELSAAQMHAGIGQPGLADRNARFRMAQATNNAETDEPVEDFIYRGNGVRGNITPINTADQFYGAKPGGAIDRATSGRGGGGTYNVHIYGGDERRVFDLVKRVLQQANITPSRVTGNA